MKESPGFPQNLHLCGEIFAIDRSKAVFKPPKIIDSAGMVSLDEFLDLDGCYSDTFDLSISLPEDLRLLEIEDSKVCKCPHTRSSSSTFLSSTWAPPERLLSDNISRRLCFCKQIAPNSVPSPINSPSWSVLPSRASNRFRPAFNTGKKEGTAVPTTYTFVHHLRIQQLPLGTDSAFLHRKGMAVLADRGRGQQQSVKREFVRASDDS